MKRRITCGFDYNEPDSSSCKVRLVEESSEPLGQPLVNSYAVHKTSSLNLVELAKEIEKADSFVQATTCSKLKVIAEQVMFLKQRAEKVLVEAKRNSYLHHAACNFKKIPDKVYHLYKRPSGQHYFSIISPEEWGSSMPHEYMESYYLERDMTWVPVAEKKLSAEKENLMLLKGLINLPQASSDNKSIECMMIDCDQ